MKLIECLAKADENKPYTVYDLVGNVLAKYDGRDSIPEELNDIEVSRAYEGFAYLVITKRK